MTDPIARHEARFLIAPDHPAFPGHFPGNPVVPGVVLLDRVLDEAERWLGHRVRASGLPHVKFLAAVRPDETLRVSLLLTGETLKFTIHRDQQVVASGAFTVHGAPASERRAG